ncbi:MAG: ABC transporter ATP-binding protein [Acaryochloridaceae cyanobacterium SU_2_1]|nr:ABC transporter ATP-binding protein [Acaryochloridaceae cyanobacterium SU_2_1]
MVDPAILQLNDLSKSFSPHGPAAVNQMSLTLNKGEILALLGPSGCGKTTLLRLIAGFERSQTGQLWLEGQLIADAQICLPPEQRSIGMVFQDFALFPHLTVAENVQFGLKSRQKHPCDQRRQRQAEVLDLVGLLGMENRYPHELSGGQQQRVALARALAPQPQLVLLDEPLSNLDVQVRLRLRQELREILKAAKISALFVTHDQEEALAICDQVAVMRQGCLEQMGTPEAIYQTPNSPFVAEFVTQANFVLAHRQGPYWQTEVGEFKVSPDHFDLPEQSEGLLMIRQEDLILEPHADALVKVRDRQFLGREYRYCLQTNSGKQLYARSSTEWPLPLGTAVKLSVRGDQPQVFLDPAANAGQVAV